MLGKHAPVRQRRVKTREKPPWLTKEIMQAMKIRDELRKQKDRRKEYKKQRNRVKNLVNKAKKNVYTKMINGGKDTASLWRAINMVTRGNTNKHKNDTTNIPPNLTADTFNNHFLSIADLLKQSSNRTAQYQCPEKLKQFCQTRTAGNAPFTIPPLGAHEVAKMITSMANKKSCGVDEISTKILKISLPYIVESLTHIYNLAITTNTFPSLLKCAKVIPLAKSKDTSDLNNFRPISLLPVLSKPLERHVQSHLSDYLEGRNLLHSLQSGFRSKHSCHTALTRLVDTWLQSIHESNVTGSLFLDLRKAFDLVNHEILLKKLELYFGNLDSLAFIRSYLTSRTQAVLLNGSYSSTGIVDCGVPQGSILGPLLFSLYINDLPLYLSCDKVTCDLFADDATLNTPDRDIGNVETRLQQSLLDVSEWCNHNQMVLHPSKTKCMVVTTRQKYQETDLSLSLSLNDNSIEQVEHHRLLGIVVDKQLDWKEHTKHVCKKVASNLFMLSKLRPFTDTDTRMVFYNAHVRSHIDYASTVWDGCSGAGLKRLNSLKRRAAKLVHHETQIPLEQRFEELDMLPLSSHLSFNKAILMYKLIRKPCPSYLKKKISLLSSASSRRGLELRLPPARIDLCKHSLSFSGAQLWNSLPKYIRNVKSFPIFKSSLFRYFASK